MEMRAAPSWRAAGRDLYLFVVSAAKAWRHSLPVGASGWRAASRALQVTSGDERAHAMGTFGGGPIVAL